MPRAQPLFVCQECGASHRKWSGKCDACDAWNSIVEETSRETIPRGMSTGGGRPLVFSGLADAVETPARRVTGNAEFDRVCGGGLVPGSAVLIAGDPGIGKSTLLLQVAAGLAGNGNTPGIRTAYVSGEEAIDQVRLRAARLGLVGSRIELASATSLRDILASFDSADSPDALVIDSIQTMYIDNLDTAPGTVGQVRACAQELIRVAKRRGAIVFIVGHVTKEGTIAGPRVLEHMVDTVLAFEGDRGHQFRILRGVKNRFGPTDEIGVFQMTGRGLLEVANPSALFLAERSRESSGSVVFAGMEGTRPVLVEIQALTAPAGYGTARRAVVGWDSARLAMILAVIETRCGLAFGGRDVFLNVAGGLRIAEPAADLAVAAALISSLLDRAVAADTVAFGEIGLSGEVRAVGQTEPRLKEAAKLGFTRALIPARRHDQGAELGGAISMRGLRDLNDLIRVLDPTPPRRAARSAPEPAPARES